VADADDIFVLSAEDVAELRRLVKWARALRGPGVTNTPTGATIAQAPPARRSQPATDFRPPLVKITGNETGGGKYTGVLWNRPTVNIPATGNLTEAEIGSANVDGEGEDIPVRIVNTREAGAGNTHDLQDSSYRPVIFPAVYLKTAEDGVPVYMIDGLQWKDCA
jgi:hypothetical protein